PRAGHGDRVDLAGRRGVRLTAAFEDEPPQDILRPIEPEDLPPAGVDREDDATRLCTTIEGVDDDPVAEEAHAGGPTVPGAVRATAIVRDVKRAGRLQEVYPLRGHRAGEGIRRKDDERRTGVLPGVGGRVVEPSLQR